MKEICYLSVLLILVFFISCENGKKEEREPDIINVVKPTIDFDPQVLNNSVWFGTRQSDGHLIYMKLEDSSSLFLLEIDTNRNEYIETISIPYFEQKDKTCLLLNYSTLFGAPRAYIYIYEHFLNNNLEDSLLKDITNSKISEYTAVKGKYFPMHFKNDLLGELNLSTLDEITFRDSSNQVVLVMEKDTFYSNYVDPGFEGRERRPLSESEYFEYEFQTDSSSIVYYLSNSDHRGIRSSYFRETLKGEKEVKWVGNIMTTYIRDFLILEYKPLEYAINNKRPKFIKIIKLDSSLLKYPFDGHY